MTISVNLIDTHGSKEGVKITSRGQLIVAPLDFSTAYQQTMITANTAVNYVVPKAGKRFVITDIILIANKNVSATVEATVDVYEANSPTSTVVASQLFQDALTKQTKTVITGLNLITSEGVWVNGKTDDDDIISTIMGYYVDA